MDISIIFESLNFIFNNSFGLIITVMDVLQIGNKKGLKKLQNLSV